jgi:N-acetyl-gamma-glutamyl-phosphate reductase
MVPQLLDAGLRVVDLSGAFRFHNPETFAHWYKLPAPPKNLAEEAIYGLPELYRDDLLGARLVANPGCYPTSVILGLKPLVDSGWIATERGIVADCKSGATGAGKEPKREMHFVEVDENFRAYGLFSHRHTPEVTDHTGIAGEDIVFTTHLLPVARGILSTLYVWFAEPHTAAEVESLYRAFYAERPMVRIWPAGKLPELQHVAHTNFCDIGFALDSAGRRLAVVSCLDNLGKGAAGQAVQNMNLMLGIEEATGLR